MVYGQREHARYRERKREAEGTSLWPWIDGVVHDQNDANQKQKSRRREGKEYGAHSKSEGEENGLGRRGRRQQAWRTPRTDVDDDGVGDLGIFPGSSGSKFLQ